jgi:hypothetical protein
MGGRSGKRTQKGVISEWLEGKRERRLLEREPQEEAGDHRRVLQGNLPRGKESSQEGRNNSLKPEMAAENF